MSLPDQESFGGILTEALQDRRERDTVWDLCNLFLQGKQGARTQAFATPQDAMRRLSRRAMYAPNLLVDYYRVASSRLVIQPPSATVLPTTPSTDDIAKAIASQELVNFFWWDADIPAEWLVALPHLLTTGNCGFRVYWNTGEDRAMLEAFGPEDLFYEPGIRNRKESMWVAQRKTVNREILKQQFPMHAKAIDDAASEDAEKKTGLFGGLFGRKKLKNRLDVYYTYARDGSQEYGIFLKPNTGLSKGKLPKGVEGIHHIG